MLNKVNNFKVFRISNEKFIFLFFELCKGLYNTFMVKVVWFNGYFKIMLFELLFDFLRKFPMI